MTISSLTRVVQYSGNGTTTAFPFAFKVFGATDALVILTDSSGNAVTQSLISQYTVSLNSNQNSNPGGTVNMVTAPPSGYTLTLSSQVPYLQPTDIANVGSFYPQSVTDALDRLTVISQQLLLGLNGAMRLPVSVQGVSSVLPPPSANMFVAWNSNATALQNVDPSTLATIVSYGTAKSDVFTGDGTTTTYALSANPGAQANLDIDIAGITQTAGFDFNWQGGTSVVFTTAPAAGKRVHVRYMQGLPQGAADWAAVTNTPFATLYGSGAVGDGVTNNTQPLQALINANYGKTILLTGGGVYKVSTLSIAGKISIIGDGQTTILFDGTQPYGVNLSNITIDGLVIRGIKFKVASGTVSAIYGVNCTITNSRISDNDMAGVYQGISITGGSSQKTYVPPFGSNYTTIGLDGRNIISGNYIHDTVAPSQTYVGYAIYTQFSGYWQIVGNRIENMQGSILSPMYGVVANNVCLAIFDDNGIYCAHSYGVTVSGNYVEGCLGDGIALNDAHFCNVVGNMIVNPGNSGIRLQQGNDHNITGNFVYGGANTSSYMRSGIDAGSPNAPYNISIVGNTFTGGTNNSGNPFAFGNVPIGTVYSNWIFSNNKIDKVNTSLLSGPFYGPYKIIQFGGTPSNVIVHDNVFTNVTECPKDSNGCYQYISASREYNNVIQHAAGYTTLAAVDSIKQSGSVRFACGAAGAVTTPTYEGLVTAITQTGTTGVYTITLARPMAIRDFSWSASGSNAPFFIRMDVINPGVTNEWASSFNITMYNAAGAAVFPNFLSSVILHFKAYSAGLGVNV